MKMIVLLALIALGVWCCAPDPADGGRLEGEEFRNLLKLYDAIAENNVAQVRTLLSLPGMRADYYTYDHESLLVSAVSSPNRHNDVEANLKIIEMLVLGGADVDHFSKERGFGTPLSLALTYGDCETAKRLLAAGADPNIPVAKGDEVDLREKNGSQIYVRRTQENPQWIAEDGECWASVEKVLRERTREARCNKWIEWLKEKKSPFFRFSA